MKRIYIYSLFATLSFACTQTYTACLYSDSLWRQQPAAQRQLLLREPVFEQMNAECFTAGFPDTAVSLTACIEARNCSAG